MKGSSATVWVLIPRLCSHTPSQRFAAHYRKPFGIHLRARSVPPGCKKHSSRRGEPERIVVEDDPRYRRYCRYSIVRTSPAIHIGAISFGCATTGSILLKYTHGKPGKRSPRQWQRGSQVLDLELPEQHTLHPKTSLT